MWAARGAISRLARSRAVSRINVCSGPSSKSILFSGPDGPALLDEGAHPFFLVLGGEELGEELLLAIDPRIERQRAPFADGPFGGGNGERRSLGDRAGHGSGTAEERRRLGDRVQNTEAQRFIRVDD